jgi:hypothetical protein
MVEDVQVCDEACEVLRGQEGSGNERGSCSKEANTFNPATIFSNNAILCALQEQFLNSFVCFDRSSVFLENPAFD